MAHGSQKLTPHGLIGGGTTAGLASSPPLGRPSKGLCMEQIPSADSPIDGSLTGWAAAQIPLFISLAGTFILFSLFFFNKLTGLLNSLISKGSNFVNGRVF